MKKIFLIVVLLFISILLASAASATTNKDDITTLNTVKVAENTNSAFIPLNAASITTKKYLIDTGANKFYWGERGGIFSYNWKTYRTNKGVTIYVNYKTKNNSWKGMYTITKTSKNKLKIVYTSPEIKLYSGHASLIMHANSPMVPVKYYWKVVKKQIKIDGYFFV
jgi:hypothetical protein